MAKTTLPTNYVDDVLNGAMDGKRRYREIPNADGTISLEDATTYDQIGNNFGASQVNLMNDNINQSFDANKMLKTMDEVNAVTQEGYGVDALVVKELNSSLGDISNIGNTTYNSVEKILQYYIDNGYLPDLKSMALIPVMTSNTTPSGVASAISEYSNSPAYYAFRNLYDDTTNTECWMANDSKGTSHSNLWLMYKFPEAVTVKKFRIRYVNTSAVNYKIQGSNDGNTFVDLGTFTTIRGEEQIQNTNAYLYYRLLITTQTTSSPNVYGGCVRDLQLYGY